MFNENNKKFNIISFVIKVVIIALSLIASLILLILSEQIFITLRSVIFRGEIPNLNGLVRFGEKEVERIVGEVMPCFIAINSIFEFLCRFVTFFVASGVTLGIILSMLIKVFAKYISVFKTQIQTKISSDVEFSNGEVFGVKNLKLSI